MVYHLFVLILSETRSLFRAAILNIFMEQPALARYIHNTSMVQKVISKTVLRYCASVVGIYLFDLSSRLINDVDWKNTLHEHLPPTRLQICVSGIALIVLIAMIVMIVRVVSKQ